MNRLAPASWGITARLVLVATVPSFVMFVVVTLALYVTGQGDARTAVRERGQLLAASLAESSRYAVVSGNALSLDSGFRRLLLTDRSIVGIEVLDAERRALVTAGRLHGANASIHEAPVAVEVPDVDTFGTSSDPHIAAPNASPTSFRPRPPAGYVRVSMSPAPLYAAMQERLMLGAGIVLAATVLSICMGLYLAQQMRAPLAGILGALRQIRQGVAQVALPTTAQGELGELQASIADVAKSVGASRAELERRVDERTRELHEAVQATQHADAERRRLIASGNKLIEDERRRIAAEIHDHLNASLIVVRMQAQTIAELAADPGEVDASSEVQRLACRIDSATDGLYVAARNIVKQLRPEVLDTLGLRGAIEGMVRSYDEMHGICRFAFEAADNFPDLPADLAITAFRLVQEALSNIVKHADARHATVRLERDEDSAGVRITVCDDGKGFLAGTDREIGVGLIGMRERVWAAAGSLHVTSKPGGGTSVEIRLPVSVQT